MSLGVATVSLGVATVSLGVATVSLVYPGCTTRALYPAVLPSPVYTLPCTVPYDVNKGVLTASYRPFWPDARRRTWWSWWNNILEAEV